MRIAVSNIAWPATADSEAAAMLTALGVSGVEVAPARVGGAGGVVTASQATAFRRAWEDRGLPVVALQALLHGRDELKLFGDAAVRRRLADHLAAMIDLACHLGATTLVFGAPRNRRRSKLGPTQAESIAIPFFRDIGRRAFDRGVWLCIEPNPPAYGCDFLVDSLQVIDFVSHVGHDGCGVHLDSGAMVLADESPDRIMALAGRRWRHFHASEPGLSPVGGGQVDHVAMAAALRRQRYEGYVSVEMSPGESGTPWRERLEPAVAAAVAAYGASADAHAA